MASSEVVGRQQKALYTQVGRFVNAAVAGAK